MRRDPIKIVSYDSEWPQLFVREQLRLEEVLAPWLVGGIEHIGSTSIPGLPAKPIIDMAARVEDYDAFAPALDALATIGWVHAPEPSDEADRHWSICYPSVEWRTHHLHVVEQTSTGWPVWLAFRDHLRVHPELVAEYAEIKKSLASKDDRDRDTYRSGKAPFIERVLAEVVCAARSVANRNSDKPRADLTNPSG